MNLLYVIPTRSRLTNVVSTISTAWRLRSGKHDVRFGVSLDNNDDGICCIDQARSVTILTEGMPVVTLTSERPDALGTKWNIPIEHVVSTIGEPAAALLMTDRMIPISPGWDNVVALCLEKHPNRVLWWRSPSDPGTVAPVVPRSWLEAMDWKPAVEAFPYWFIDTHLMELDRFIHGGASLMMPCFYAGERKATMELRDVAFWCRYYAALRPQRLAQAKQIAERLGIAWVERPELQAEFGAQDAGRLARAAEFEAAFGDASVPWEGYRRIKAVAQVWMDTRDQTVMASYEISQRLIEAGYPMDPASDRAIQVAALDAMAGLP